MPLILDDFYFGKITSVFGSSGDMGCVQCARVAQQDDRIPIIGDTRGRYWCTRCVPIALGQLSRPDEPFRFTRKPLPIGQAALGVRCPYCGSDAQAIASKGTPQWVARDPLHRGEEYWTIRCKNEHSYITFRQYPGPPPIPKPPVRNG